MKTSRNNRIAGRRWAMALVLPLALLAAGCAGPNKENIDLRKKIQQLEAKIDNLDRVQQADKATILGLQTSATTVPVLPANQLDELYTAHGLSFGRLTGGYHDPGASGGDTELKVYVTPIDAEGDDLKAAGSFKIELFDLSLKDNQRIGTWNFDLNQSKSLWLGKAMMYGYVLHCPWQTAPTHAGLHLRTTFSDELTHRVFVDDREIKVQVPGAAATRPSLFSKRSRRRYASSTGE